MDYFDEDAQANEERKLLGYCAYDKSEIYEGDDFVKYKGKLYHRENFLQSQLDTNGEFINEDEE